jgi:glutathione S-transferase
VVALPIDSVWVQLRQFNFPAKLLSSIVASVSLEEGKDATTVGAVRTVKWRSGEMKKQRLIALSDQYHFATWELIDSEPHEEVTAVLTTVRCIRVTESNHTLIIWSAEYSADVSPDLLRFSQKSFQQTLSDLRVSLTGQRLPTLYHLHEGPSTRVLWLCHEISLPIEVKDVPSGSPSLKRSLNTELPGSRGGAVTTLIESDGTTMLESGAILLHLLEKHRPDSILLPKIGTPERALYHKFLFLTASTVDHLLFDAYKLMFVTHTASESDATLRTAKAQWDSVFAREYEKELDKHMYICGDEFTVADIMVGWSMHFANLLGWLEGHPTLQAYLNSVSQRPAYRSLLMSDPKPK